MRRSFLSAGGGLEWSEWQSMLTRRKVFGWLARLPLVAGLLGGAAVASDVKWAEIDDPELPNHIQQLISIERSLQRFEQGEPIPNDYAGMRFRVLLIGEDGSRTAAVLDANQFVYLTALAHAKRAGAEIADISLVKIEAQA